MKELLRRMGYAALLAVLCLALTGCGGPSAEFNEEVILKSMPSSACVVKIDSSDNTLIPTAVTIDSQEESEGLRILRAELVLENENYRLTRTLKMNFDFNEKDGWRLGYFTDLSDPTCVPVSCPFSQEDAFALLEAEGLDTGAVYQDIAENPDGYTFNYKVNRKETNLTLTGTVQVNYRLIRTPAGHFNWTSQIIDEKLNYDWHFLGHYKVSTVAGYYEVDFTSYDHETGEMDASATRKDKKNYVYKDPEILGYVNISPGEKPHGTRCIKVKMNWNGDPKIFFIYPDVILLEDNEVWDLDKLS